MKIIEIMRGQAPQKENIWFRPTVKSALFKVLPFCALSAVLLKLAIKENPFFIFLTLAAVYCAIYKYISIRSSYYWIKKESIEIKTGILFAKFVLIDISSLECIRATRILMVPISDLKSLVPKTISSEEFEQIVNRIPLKDLEILDAW